MAASKKFSYRDAMLHAYKGKSKVIKAALTRLGGVCDELFDNDYIVRAMERGIVEAQDFLLPGFSIDAYLEDKHPRDRVIAAFTQYVSENELHEWIIMQDDVYLALLEWYINKDPKMFVERLQTGVDWVTEATELGSESETSTESEIRRKQKRNADRRDARNAYKAKRPKYGSKDRDE